MNFQKLMMMSFSVLSANAALAFPQIPSACPDVSALAKAGVNQAIQDKKDSSWIVTRDQFNYGTDSDWKFYIGVFSSESSSDVLTAANATLPKLVLTETDSDVKNDVRYFYCFYQHETDDNLAALAVSPPLAIETTLKTKMKNAIN